MKHHISSEQGLEGIQTAIDNAQTGDIIHCAAGTFNGTRGLKLPPGIRLSGTLDPNQQALTLLHCQFSKPQKNQALIEIKNGTKQQISQLQLKLSWQQADFSNLKHIGQLPSHIRLIKAKQLTLKQLHIHHHDHKAKINGILLKNCDNIDIQQNHLSQQFFGVVCLDSQNIDIINNQAQDNQWSGIVYSDSSGTAKANRLLGNQEHGRGIQEDSHIYACDNQAQDNQRAGIYYSHSSGTVQANILGSNRAGIVSDANDLVIRSNILYENDLALLTQKAGRIRAVDCLIQHHRSFAERRVGGRDIDSNANPLWCNGNPLSYKTETLLKSPPSDQQADYPLWWQLQGLQQRYSSSFAYFIMGFGSLEAARAWLPEPKKLAAISNNIWVYQYSAAPKSLAVDKDYSLQPTTHPETWGINFERWLREREAVPDCWLLFHQHDSATWQQQIKARAQSFLSLQVRAVTPLATISLWEALAASEDKSWQRWQLLSLTLWRSLPFLLLLYCSFALIPELDFMALLRQFGRLANDYYMTLIHSLERFPLFKDMAISKITSLILVVLGLPMLTFVLAVGLAAVNALLPTHLHIRLPKWLNKINNISDMLIKPRGRVKIMPQQALGRRWLYSLLFQKSCWQPWSRYSHSLFIWHDCDQVNEADQQVLAALRALAARKKQRLLLLLNLREKALIPICARPLQSDSPTEWLILEDQQKIASSTASIEVLAQKIFATDDKDLLKKWRDKRFSWVDLPLLASLISSSRLAVRYAVPLRKEAYKDAKKSRYSASLVRPTLREMMRGVLAVLPAELLAAKADLRKRQTYEDLKSDLPANTQQQNMWFWHDDNEQDQGNSWRVFITRPFYKQSIRAILTDLDQPPFYLDHVAALQEYYYLRLARAYLQEAEEAHDDDVQKRYIYAAAVRALEAAFEQSWDIGEALPVYEDAQTQRKAVIEAFLNSSHPEPERIAGLLLRFYDAKDPDPYPLLRSLLADLKQQLNHIWVQPLAALRLAQDCPALYSACMAQFYQKLYLLVFLPTDERINHIYFNRFYLQHWFWLKQIPALDFPDDLLFFQQYTVDEAQEEQRERFVSVREVKQQRFFYYVWQNTPASKTAAAQLGRVAALNPAVILSSMLAYFQQQRLVKTGLKSTFPLNEFFAALLQPFPENPQPMPILAAADDFPWLPFWEVFTENYRANAGIKLDLTAPLPPLLAGLGYDLMSTSCERLLNASVDD